MVKTAEEKKNQNALSYIVTTKGERIDFTIGEIKQLRGIIKNHYYRKNIPKDSLIVKLNKLGYVHSSLRHDADRDTIAFRKNNENCFICGCSKDKNLHHKIFPINDDLGSNRKIDTMILCRQCHLELHDKIVDEMIEIKKNKVK